MSDVRPNTPELLVPATMFAAQGERVLYMDGAKESETGWRTTSLGILVPDTADQKVQGAMPLHVDDADVLLWNEVTRARARENGAMVMWLENEGQPEDQINAERERLDFYIQLQQAMGGKLIVGAKDHRAGDLIKYYKADGVFTTDSVEGLIDGIGNALLADAEFIANNPGEYVTDQAATASPLDRPTINDLTGNSIHDAAVSKRERIEVINTPSDEEIAAERLKDYVKATTHLVSPSCGDSADTKKKIKQNAVWFPSTGTAPVTKHTIRNSEHRGKDPWFVTTLSYISEHGNTVYLRMRVTPNKRLTVFEHLPHDIGIESTENGELLATIRDINGDNAEVTYNGKPITLQQAYLAYQLLSKAQTSHLKHALTEQYDAFFKQLLDRAEAS